MDKSNDPGTGAKLQKNKKKGKDGDGGGGGGYQGKAQKRYVAQARTIQLQIDAVKKALGGNFKDALNVRLGNLLGAEQTQDTFLRESYAKRVADLEGTSEDNEKSAATQGSANLTNAARERANALSQAALQGAGETDVLQSQLMALRNWSQNQTDINTAVTDTARSIKSSLTDLNVDTKTALANNQIQVNSDREQLWNDFYDQKEGAQTQLGNLLGQKAEVLGYANEAKGSKKLRKKQKAATKASGQAFDKAAGLSGKAFDDPGVSPEIREWTGTTTLRREARAPVRTLNSSATDIGQPARPEGAALRKWS